MSFEGMARSSSFKSGYHSLYKELAWIYDEIYVHIFPYEEILDFVDGVLKKYGCRKILEAACGTGRLMEMLEKKRYEVTGLDLSGEMLEIARKKTNGKLLRQDMRNNVDEFFDALICLGRSFTYMLTDNDVENALKSFNNTLKSGGILIFDNFNAGKKDESYFKEWKKKVFELGTFRVTRLNKSFDYDERNNSWVVKWKYIIERDNEKESVYDQARLRAFHGTYLKKKLKKCGFQVLESLHKWNSLILIAKRT
jgi:SAM-dependent methyltransferase